MTGKGGFFYVGDLVAQTKEDIEARLVTLRATIAAIEEGSREVRRGERSFTEADLPVLYKQEGRLEKRLDRLSDGSVKQVVPK